MAHTDLHLHSWYSDHPSEWFLQRIGANESYTDPEYIYTTAKERGMDFVTITDHNAIQGAVELQQRHPDDVFVSVEATSYFPDDGCKIHVLCYGISEEQFRVIQETRRDIYALRDFIKSENIAHSIAHATYAVNDMLTVSHLEKLLLLFDTFEGINGSRAKMSNQGWMCVLGNLTPEHIDKFHTRHGIEPFSDTPWEKGLTGGSDDHGGIFIGRTYTVADADTVDEFITALKNTRTLPAGRHNDYHSLAFTLYKIAYDFSRTKSSTASKGLVGQLTRLIFDGSPLSFTGKLKLRKLRSFSKNDENSIHTKLVELIDTLREKHDDQIEDKFALVYDKVADITDAFFTTFTSTVLSNAEKGDVAEIIKSISSSLPGVFLSVPFFTTLSHMCQGQTLINRLLTECEIRPDKKTRVLWFTDFLTDIDGISVMVKKLGWYAYTEGRDMKIVTTVKDEEYAPSLPPNIMKIPSIYEIPVPRGKKDTLYMPSVLKALKMIYEFEPDEIIISTPGPMGLLGVLAGKLLKVRTTGVYHAELSEYEEPTAPEDALAHVIQSYMHWFYSLMDDIRVPAVSCMDRLEKDGLNRSKMSVFPRGIDTHLFAPSEEATHKIRHTYNIENGFCLCYVGCVSHNRNLAFLCDVYTALLNERDDITLIIAGDGSDKETYQNRMKEYPRVIFTGAVPRDELPAIYSVADLLLFPGRSDTFGLPILEAHACGVPAIAADLGGARDIIEHGVTGFVLPSHSIEEWVAQTMHILKLKENNLDVYNAMGSAARRRAHSEFTWENVCKELLNDHFDDDTHDAHAKQKDVKKVKESVLETPEPVAV